MNPPLSRRDDVHVITAGERAWGQAYVTGDVTGVERLLADDFLGVDPHGNEYDKAAVLKDVGRGDRATSDEVGAITIRFYGDTAIAQAHETERGPAPKRLLSLTMFTDTWVKSGGRWRIVAAEDLDPRCSRK
ncbi:MAG TPA: nuclear transport factor 2 family protein [Rhizomicrobium sp.]